MKLITATSCLAFLAIATCIPQHRIHPREATQLPNYTQLSSEQIKHLQNRGFGPTAPTPFRPTVAYVEDEDDEEDDEDISPASTQVRRPAYSDDAYIQNIIPIQTRPAQRPQQQQQQQQQQQVRRPQQQYAQQQSNSNYGKQDNKEKTKLEEEEEEPDRLTLLLPQSRFECSGKNTGYYADEELGCEVFHYCQENAKHSWICPEGFTFHQVHLICMPPGGDNICAKSSQYHFVNEYLYKPVNLEEHQNQPNVSLKYSDRYYPENYYQNNKYEEDEDGERIPPQQYHHQSRKPIRVGFQQQQVAPQQQVLTVVRRPNPTQYSPTIRPETTIGQVFRSPEEVNISLQQRRPTYVTQRYREELGGY